MTEVPRFLDPRTLSSLSSMEMRARIVVEGFVSGLHKSPYRGFGVEFVEYRQYTPGDDIRHVDWKAVARSDRYYVKEYEDETNLQCVILLDRSASMGYGGQPATATTALDKLEYGSYLAASLAYLILRQGDGVGLVTFDQVVHNYVPPSSKNTQWLAIHSTLDELRADEGTDLGSPLHELAESMPRRGLVILISDLIDDVEQMMNALMHFRFKGHEVLVFHIVDREELTFPFSETARFDDPETGERITVAPSAIRADYLAAVEEFMESIRTGCAKIQVDYERMETDRPLDFALFSYLSRRMVKR
ncbi:MAG: DUF58 domain-containing protein [Gemmatimonadota bacterium]|nr:DUF58 domain-containing protein [Gemmatimonadota bacterium]MXW05287.1 DUF58 domain-containing protein [Gemmatimonadota bacterium]MYB61049.1 DUF58 domain-containing protein [Gemmatimonadota bacterium]